MDYLTVEDVARITHASPQAVRRWRHEGKGPRTFKVGRRLLYSRSDVDDWIRQHQVADGAA